MADQNPTPGVSGGGAFKSVDASVTFDDVPENETPSSPSTPSSSPSPEPASPAEESPAVQNADQPDSPEASEQAPSSPDKPEEQTDAPEKAGEADNGAVTPATLFKIKQGDTELDVAADAQIEVVVDGAPQSVTLEELRNNYSGKVAYDKKFNDLGKQRNAFESERKAFTQDRSALVESVNTLHKLAIEQKDPQAAIEALGSMMGADNPHQLWVDLTNKVVSQLSEAGLIEGVDQEGLQQRLKDEKLAAYENRDAKAKADAEQQGKVKAMQTELDSVIAGSGAKSPEEVGAVMDDLRSLHKELMATGEFKPNELTPKMLGEYYQDLKASREVRGVLKDVPGITNQDEAFSEMMDIRSKHPELSVKDIADIAKTVYGNAVAKTLSRKVLKGEPAKAKPKVAPVATKEPIGFEDVD